MNKGPRARRSRNWDRSGYLFILAPLVSICVFFVYPFARALWFSLFEYNGLKATWVGVGNYVALWTDPVFLRAARNTLEFGVKSVLLGAGLALVSALIINSITRGKAFFRAAFFLPMVTNLVAVSFLWQLLYHRNGLINDGLRALGLHPIAWLQNSHTAMNAVVVTSVWQGFGYSLILLLAGLEAIPREYYEAALVDGANAMQRFWHITLPQLRYVFLFISITGVSGASQVFTQVQLMTGGGPANATRTVMFDLFQRFTQLHLGEANAVGIMIFVVLAVFAVINLRLFAAQGDL